MCFRINHHPEFPAFGESRSPLEVENIRARSGSSSSVCPTFELVR
jgi:hypothetical protein